jgi:hypothetical protein
MFFALFSVLALVAVGWPWRRAIAADWLAGAACLSAFPLLLTVGDRAAFWRKPAGAALWVCGLYCLARYARLPGPVPPLETMIVAGLGAAAAGGAAYLGLWGTDAEEIFWARCLAPGGGLLLAVAGLAWSVPEGRGWTEVLAAEGASVWREWVSSGGVWRWGGLAALLIACVLVRRRKGSGERPAEGRKLNWNG